MANDKTYVQVSQNPNVKVSEGQTIVKDIQIGAPIKRVSSANFNANLLNGESGGYYLNFNNFNNVPLILDSADVLQLLDSDALDNLGLGNVDDSATGVKLTGPVKITGHIIPDENVTYDLGSPTNKFRALYIAGRTLFLGGISISEDSNGNVVIAGVDSNGITIAGTSRVIATDIDSAVIERIVDSAYVTSRVNTSNFATQSNLDSAINALIDAAPEQLNTLNELAAALNDDSNAFNTLTGLINQKLDSSQVTAIIDSDYVQARASGNVLPIGASTDASYEDGFITSALGSDVQLTSNTLLANALDNINEVLLNVAKDQFVQSVSFTGTPLSGGAGTTVTLSLTSVGNPNRYDIYWGDGTIDSNGTSTSPTHTYSSNTGSPFTVRVVARNSNSSGAGSEADFSRSNYVVIYTADPVAAFALYRNPSGGSSLSGNDLYVIEGNSLYLENITTNTTGADVTYTINWGDGTAVDSADSDGASGGVTGSRLQHTWADGTTSGSGRDTVTLTLETHSTATPGVTPTSATASLKVYDPDIAAPNALSTKTITAGFSSVGTSPALVSGFTDNTGGASTSAGSSIDRVTTSGAVETAVLSSFAYDADSGSLSAIVNGSADGAISLTSADNSGTATSLVITEENDYNLLSAAGSTLSFASSIYHPGLYKGFKAKVSKSSLATGVHSYQLSHSTQGNTNTIEFVKDDVTSTASISAAGSLTENVAGTKRYISGIPYYNSGSPSLTLSGVQISNLTGQTYRDASNIVQVLSGTNAEGTSSSAISTQSYTYANIDGSSTMLSSGTPIANVGVSSAYAIGNLTVPITTSSVRTVEQLSVRANNVNGTGSSSSITEKIQVHTAAQSGISEIAIAVADALGETYDDDGIRIFDFSSETTDNPSYTSSTNFYTNSVYSEASDPGVAGTKEATVRLGVIKHDVTNYASGFLPAGPNRSGDTGTQYFTFAFRRTVVSNFTIAIVSSTGIEGMWIAAPGTGIDNSSTINGWLDCGIAYNGSGLPGADTGNGGNGSNGCASTSGDVIGTGALNGSFTMTLGTESLTNATSNVALVRIALASGDQITSLSIS